MRPRTSGTARRLFVAFAGLVTIFAASSFFALRCLHEVNEGVRRMTEYEDGVRMALELASAVRDQYAHQAHTIILGNDSHLPCYADTERRVRQLTAAVRARVRGDEERAWVDDIDRFTTELDRIFRDRIVPAVHGRAANVQAGHGRAQVVVTNIQERVSNNPLAVILGYVELLGKKATGQAGDDLKAVEDEALRAKEIVDGLLDLSRPLTVHPQPVDLRALSDEAVARLREAHQLDSVEVTVEGEGRVDGHPRKLRQVLVNLLKNAAEASGAGGRVGVRIERVGASVELIVQDLGPRLSDLAREKLFEPFFTTKPRGTGLGREVH